MNLQACGLECGVLLACLAHDLDAFSRNFAQLKPLYQTTTGERKSHILGLNLMFLLVGSRLSEFHAELELLSDEEAASVFVKFPVEIERQLMVGSYDQVLNAKEHIPDASYEFFMDSLSQTVRDSIADCMEVSYDSMELGDAMKMMIFQSTEELQSFIEDCRDDWIVEGGSICFQTAPSERLADIPSMELIAQNLSYATEMERII